MSRKVKVISYEVNSLLRPDKYYIRHIVVEPNDEISIFEKWISDNHNVTITSALYLSSVSIPKTPPFIFDSSTIENVIKEQGDRQLFRKTLNDKKSIVILFQIGLKNVLEV